MNLIIDIYKIFLTFFMIKAYNIDTEQKHLVFLSGGCLHHPDFLLLDKDKTCPSQGKK